MSDQTTDREKAAKDWEDYVRDEVNTLLNVYLPVSKNGNIGIKYYKDVLQRTESGVRYDETKAVGVQMHIVFEFAQPVDLVGEEPK